MKYVFIVFTFVGKRKVGNKMTNYIEERMKHKMVENYFNRKKEEQMIKDRIFRNIIIAIIIVTFIMCSLVVVNGKTNDKQLVNKYCKKHYPTRSIKYTTNDRVAYKKSKKKVYVLVEYSKSKGYYGYTKNGNYIRYNKKVKKDKTIKSYFVFNPKNNYCDDIVAVIDNGRIR